MSWKERRLITILSTILLILVIALILVLALRYREHRAEPDTDQTPTMGSVTDRAAFNSLSYDNGSTTLSFERDENGVWHWTADRDLPLDDSVIQDILAQLTVWDPQQTLTDSAALESSGLGEPTGSLTAATENGTYTTLLFGKTTTDGASRYVRLNGDESTAYIVDDSLFTLMQTPVYDMCRLPDLPVLESSRIQRVTISGPEQEGGTLVTTLLPQHADGSTATSWRADGANVTDDPQVKALLEDLAALAFSKCVDYAPSEEAASICGLDAPAAVLRVDYVTESGAEQTLELTIGNRVPDKSGRYVRLAGGDAIYLLATDLLDPLMRVASSGLDG